MYPNEQKSNKPTDKFYNPKNPTKMKTPIRLIVVTTLTATIILGASLGLAFGQDTPPPEKAEKIVTVEVDFDSVPEDDEIIWFFGPEDMAFAEEDFSDPANDILMDFEFDFSSPDIFLFPDTNLSDPENMPEEYRRQMREVRRQMEEVRREMRKVGREMRKHQAERQYAFKGKKPGYQMMKMQKVKGFPFHRFMMFDSLDADSVPQVIMLKRRDGSDSMVKKIVLGPHRMLFMGDSLCPGMASLNADSIRMIARKAERRQLQKSAKLYRQPLPRARDFEMTVPRSGRSLALNDLNDSDIKRLKNSSLKPAKPTQALGIDRVKVSQAGRDKVRLKFTAPQNKELEIILYDEEGESFYHEVLKQFEGAYDKVIQTGPFREIYLKLKQGKKSLTKKIIPDR